MESSRLRFSRLNLARSGAKYLSIVGIFEMTEERLALLSDHSDHAEGHRRKWEGPSVVSSVRYKPSGRSASSYAITTSVHVARAFNEIHVAISYRESPADTPRRRVGGVSEGKILEMAQAMGVPSEVDGRVLFEFADKQPSQLWFPLPVSLSGPSPEDTFEVRGVRAVKLGDQDGETEYEFILDRPTGEQVVLQIELRLEGTISPSSVRTVLQRAEGIAGDLVTHL